MSTVTIGKRAALSGPAKKRKPASAATAKRHRKGAQETPPKTGSVVPLARLAVGSIEPHPAQPRQHFDTDEIAELAVSLQSQGQLQPIVVRRHPAKGQAQQYQLLAGERRLRAARAAGWLHIESTIRSATDAEALAIMATENAQRRDLKPLEVARELQTLTKPEDQGGGGLTQDAAGRLFGHKQGWVSNTLRLLDLSTACRALLEDGTISARHARAMVPWIGYHEIIDALLRWIEQEGLPPAAVWETDTISDIVYDHSQPMQGDVFAGPANNRRMMPIFEPTDAQRAKLGIVEVGMLDAKTSRATNVTYWDKLMEKQATKWLADEKTKETQSRQGAKTPGKVEGAERKAERQAAAKKPTKVEEKAADEERAKRFRDGVRCWSTRFLRVAISDALLDKTYPKKKYDAMGQRTMLWLLCSGCWGEQTEAILVIAKCHGGLIRRNADLWANLATVAPAKLPDLLFDVVVSAFADDGFGLDRDVLIAAAGELGLDVPREWRRLHAAGHELIREFYELHNRQQLERLAAELKVRKGVVTTISTAAAWVDFLVAAVQANRPLPKALGPLVKELKKAAK